MAVAREWGQVVELVNQTRVYKQVAQSLVDRMFEGHEVHSGLVSRGDHVDQLQALSRKCEVQLS